MILKVKTNKMKQLLFVVNNEFLPSPTDHQTGNRLRKQSMLVFISMCFVYFSALGYASACIILPLPRGRMELPFNVNYGFNVSRNPIYEILYTMQAINQLFTVLHGILGHDYLFLVLCSNVMAQFILLNTAVVNVLKHEFAKDRLRLYILQHNNLLRY